MIINGIDIDWGYPVERGDNIPHLEEGRINLVKLLQKIRECTGKHKLLIVAISANPNHIKSNYRIQEMNQIVDWFNLICYDCHGG